MQIAINKRSCLEADMVLGNIVEEDSMALDSMVLAHSNVGVVGMDRSKDRDRSSSLLMRGQKLP